MPGDRFNMVVKRTKYVLLEGCGSARLANAAIEKQVEKISKEVLDLKCQQLVGCTAGCLEKVKDKSPNSKDCREFSECIGVCQAEAVKKPLEIGQPEEISSYYRRYRREYNRLLGAFQRPHIRAPAKASQPLPQIKPGSSEFFLRQHRRSLGRPRGSYY